MSPRTLGIRLQTPTLIGCLLLKSALTFVQLRDGIICRFFGTCQAPRDFLLSLSPSSARAELNAAHDYSRARQSV
jgi:hypothetical protein